MSEERAQQIADALLGAFTEREPEPFIELCDPEIELLLPRNLLEGGSYHGHDGVRQAFADAFESWESFSGRWEAVRAVGDRVVGLGHVVQVARHQGPPVDYKLGWIFTLREGRIIRVRPYLDHQDALEAAGLSE